jgi:hypothetical protein
MTSTLGASGRPTGRVGTSSAFGSSPRALRGAIRRVGCAATMTALSIALFLPHPALAEASAPPAAAFPVLLAQAPDNSFGDVPNAEPDESDSTGDEDQGSPADYAIPTSPDAPANPAPSDTTLEKGTTATPDSLLNAKTTLPRTVGAGLDTLGFVPPATRAARRQSPVATPPERKTLLGLHPAVFFLGLVVGHILIVKAITN